MSVAKDLYDAFSMCGERIYLVGGSVRDLILKRPSNDLDFATSARPSTIKTILNAMEVDAVWNQGEKFGTIGALLDGIPVEITTYRYDTYEIGNRKPDVVFGDTLLEDLARRDFTINAMAMDLAGDTNIIDPHGGMEDIRKGIVRFVGEPKARIMEDPLRMLRAVRFASQLDFNIDPESSYWMVSQSYMLGNISQERIAEELVKMLMTQQPSYAINELKAHDLLQRILPEIARLDMVDQDERWHFGNVYEHTMKVLDESFPSVEQRLAALFHDSGKADTREEKADGTVTFYNHEKLSGAIASNALRRLKFDNRIRGMVVHLCRMHMRPLALINSGMSTKALRKFIRDCYNEKYGIDVFDVLRLNEADVLGHKTPSLSEFRELLQRVTDQQKSTPIEDLRSPLDGNDLLRLFPEMEAGPWVGYIKGYLTNLVVYGMLNPDDREMAKFLAEQEMKLQKGRYNGNLQSSS